MIPFKYFKAPNENFVYKRGYSMYFRPGETWSEHPGVCQFETDMGLPDTLILMMEMELD